MSHEQRDPPAYQEYAAAMLAQLPFRLLSLSQRGLLYTMRLECWVNRHLPSEPAQLAAVIGQPAHEVEENLEAVMHFFNVTDGGLLVCPELEKYREQLMNRRAKQREGGKKGAAKTNQSRRKESGDSSSDNASGNSSPDLPGTPSGNPRAPRRGAGGSLVQSSSEQISSDQSNPVINGRGDTDEWLAEYEEQFHG